MSKALQDKKTFMHDCEDCVYVGSIREEKAIDIYYHQYIAFTNVSYSVVLRDGNAGWEYASGSPALVDRMLECFGVGQYTSEVIEALQDKGMV